MLTRLLAIAFCGWVISACDAQPTSMDSQPSCLGKQCSSATPDDEVSLLRNTLTLQLDRQSMELLQPTECPNWVNPPPQTEDEYDVSQACHAASNQLKAVLLGDSFSAEHVKPLFEQVGIGISKRGKLSSPKALYISNGGGNPQTAKEIIEKFTGLTEVVDVDLTQTPKFDKGLLAGVGAIFLSAGDPMKEISAIHQSDFVQAVYAEVMEGKIVIIGKSAGMIVASHDVDFTEERASEADTEGNLKGLGLIGKCTIRPHMTKRSWPSAYNEANGDLKQSFATRCQEWSTRFPDAKLLTLYDGDQSVLVNDGKVKLVGRGMGPIETGLQG